ncbi:MAG: helix-turn-helix domain-containing protein [Firmicutes bacterium]|nr:helix-turn-helix domain-containing protein [Bacillota bacterium]
MLLEELAGDLVKLTSSLVGGRTINIMNTDGIIVASSDQSRVGSYHHGAKEVVLKGSPVNIYKDQLQYYHGAKEGCNMPIRLNGVVVGVIGMYGNPDEIQETAQLLKVYVEKYYQLESLLRPIGSEDAVRELILTHLFTPTEETMNSARTLMSRMQIQLTFPVQVLMISAKEALDSQKQITSLSSWLDQLGFLDRHTDIWGILNKHLVLIASSKAGRNTASLQELIQKGYRISLGRPAATLWEIRDSYKQAFLLDSYESEPWQDMADLSTRTKYLMIQSGSESADLLDGLVKRFTETFSSDEQKVLLMSVKAYYDCDRSIQKAAGMLFVHKNTLQYRIKRVISVLRIEELPPFWQEYLLRLLVQRFQKAAR